MVTAAGTESSSRGSLAVAGRRLNFQNTGATIISSSSPSSMDGNQRSHDRHLPSWSVVPTQTFGHISRRLALKSRLTKITQNFFHTQSGYITFASATVRTTHVAALRHGCYFSCFLQVLAANSRKDTGKERFTRRRG